MKKYKRYIFILVFSFCLYFIPKNAFAFDWSQTSPPFFPIYNYNTNFFYAGENLNAAKFFTFGAGNNKIDVDGSVKNFEFSDNILEPGQNFYLYFNLNLCTDTNYQIHSPNMIDHMYVYNSSQSCNFNGSSYKGHVAQIYFRVMSVNQLQNYSGSFYLSADKQHSVELINYQSNFQGFPLAFSNDYAKDLEDLKNIIRDNSSGIKDSIDKNTQTQEEIKDSITNSDTTESQDEINGFFEDFTSDDYGLSDVITMPLEFIKGLASSKCNSLILPLPFVETNLTLPCMNSVYNQYFGSFLNLYQIITTGFIAYWVCINIFRLVQGFKNPDNDEVEVMDL